MPLSRTLSRCLFVAAIAAALAPFSSVARAADPGKITIQVDKPGAKISPLLFGLMTEEINYSYEGGLYGELIPNRSLSGSGGGGGGGGGRGRGGAGAGATGQVAPHWSLYTGGGAGGGQGTAAVDNSTVKGAIEHSLKVSLTNASADAPVGVASDGYWGIPVRPDTTYTASVYAKAGDGFTGPLTASLMGNDGKVYASAKFDVGGEWELKKFTLKTGGGFAPTADAKYVITGASKGSFSVTQVSLFPPVFKERAAAALGSRPTTGFRPDIMQLLNDMHPAFLRFPGGNYVEGPNLNDRYNFKITIGSWENRPGHGGSWGYRSSDGLGLLEFLEWCEDIHMEPVLAVWAGLNLNGGRGVVTGDALRPYIQDALDEIEYVSGDKSTTWGAKRAADGHPEPFKLTYVEIGNEDNLSNGAASYRGPDGRFALFYTAIKAKYPSIQVIATTNPNTTHDVIDNHAYMSPTAAIRAAHQYDRTDRNGPKVFEGEWASQEAQPRPLTPTMQAAISDGAFLTGLQRNADIVIMSCYAPLLTRIENGGHQWNTDLIGYDTLTSYGSPSYYVQKMFNNARGDVVIPVAGITPQQPGAAAQAFFMEDGTFAVAAPAGPAAPGVDQPPAERPAHPAQAADAARVQVQVPAAPAVVVARPKLPNANEPLFACASSEDKTGDIILKVVNVFPNEQAMEIDLGGAAKILPNATAEVLSGAPNETNSITDPMHCVPKPLAITDASAQWKHTFPGNSVTVIRFKTK